MGADTNVHASLPGSRLSGTVLVAGALAMFAGAAVPFLTELGGEAWTGSPDQVLEAVATNPTAWRWANLLIAGAAVTTAIALVLAVGRFDAEPLVAVAGVVAFSIAATLEMAGRILNSTITPWIARNSSQSPEFGGLYEFSEGLLTGFILLAFVSLVLFGVSALREREALLGATLIAFGIVGAFLELVGAAIPALVYIGTGALGLWLLVNPEGPLEQTRTTSR